jgi:hypothetical protein
VVIRDHRARGQAARLAVADRQRLPILPDVPTMAEAGFPIEGSGWNGIFVPAGTPPAIVERLQARSRSVLRSKEMQDDAAPRHHAGGERRRSSPPSCARGARSGARSSRTQDQGRIGGSS